MTGNDPEVASRDAAARAAPPWLTSLGRRAFAVVLLLGVAGLGYAAGAGLVDLGGQARGHAWTAAAFILVAGGWVGALSVRMSRQQVDALQRERHAQEEHLRALRLLEAVADASPDAIFAKDIDGRYLLFNRAAGEILGCDPALALGVDDRALMPPEQADASMAFDREVVESGQPFSAEEELDTPSGLRTFHTIKGPLRDHAGRVIGIFGISRDISHRREHEQQLRQLSMAVEQSSESIVITDLAANIVYANAAALNSSGYSREELLGRNSRVLQSGRTPRETYAALWGALRTGKPWRGHLFNRRKDGREYVEHAVISPIRMPHGRITHYLAVKEDVTEKQRMAAELDRYRLHLEELVAQRTAELEASRRVAEAANEAKSAFLATMSHEIRTPMNGVVGLADVLRQSSLTPYQADLVETMRESSFALLSIIDDLLDFSKIEAGRLELEHEPVEIRTLVEAACDALRATASTRGVHLQIFVDPSLPRRIVTDAVRWRQVLNNLVGNAIKFSAGLARAGRVEVRVERDGPDTMRMTVADNGIGMGADALGRIFRPFMQAEGSTTRRYGGTGLGLSIVHRLVDAFDGRIEVDSRPDHGSSFRVTLPMHAVPGDEAPPPPEHDLSGIECHLLLDDHQLARDWAAYLTSAGASLVSHDDDAGATGLEAGLQHSRSDPADVVVVTGVARPDAWLREVRAIQRAHGVKLVHLGRGQRRTPRIAGDGEVGIDADAMHREALLRAVALASGRVVPDVAEAPGGMPAGGQVPPSVDEAAARGRLVLVAEDNPINRKVIRRQLALLGLASEVVDDGLQALERWRSGRYALLLTDLHMPGLDGYELTARIRAEEPVGQRLPVVALTATALYGEAERCRAAGMDDYLSKPVTRERLATTMERWLPVVTARDDQHAATARTGDVLIHDPSVLPALIGDDAAMLARIRREFLASGRAAADELQAAVGAGDLPGAGAVAHRLKSSSRAVGAMALGDLCERIENAGRSGDGAALRAAHASFDAALAAASERIQACLADPLSAAGAAATEESGPRVMIVDDDPFQIQVMRQQLSLLGLRAVASAASGTEALQALKGRDCSRMLLMLDLSMPGMDGIELMRRLATNGWSGSLVLVSAADERVLESGARLAAEHRLDLLGHVHKPVSSETLRTLIERWQRRSPARVPRKPKLYAADQVREAIREGQLRVHYQPKVSLADGTLTGVEALVRWQHPEDGLVSPDSFVPVAEEAGLVDALTRTVLAIAVAQARQWRSMGLAPRVAVNVSMDDLVRLDFPEQVLQLLAAHGLPPESLQLEVTESRLMRDPRAALDILTRLRLHGIGLAIDDFGTGHSSLAQLRDLPFDELKIDRGFVRGCGDNATRRAIVVASIEMAHQLGMRTVAEGVEDLADWQAVHAAGCDIAQGWYIGRPMPAEQLPNWLSGLGERLAEAA